jgi:hypothetical protein
MSIRRIRNENRSKLTCFTAVEPISNGVGTVIFLIGPELQLYVASPLMSIRSRLFKEADACVSLDLV